MLHSLGGEQLYSELNLESVFLGVASKRSKRDSGSHSIIPINLEDFGVIEWPLCLVSSYSRSVTTPPISEGSAMLGFQNLASGGRGLFPKSWAKAFANT